MKDKELRQVLKNAGVLQKFTSQPVVDYGFTSLARTVSDIYHRLYSLADELGYDWVDPNLEPKKYWKKKDSATIHYSNKRMGKNQEGGTPAEAMKHCTCAEMKDRNGNKIVLDEFAKYHNCEYVRARSKLVPQAMSNVLARFGDEIPNNRFNRMFVEEMDKLVRENKVTPFRK